MTESGGGNEGSVSNASQGVGEVNYMQGGGNSNRNRNSPGIGTVKAQKGPAKTRRHTQWVPMWANPR